MLIQHVQLENIDALILVPGSTTIYGLCDTINRVIARSSLVFVGHSMVVFHIATGPLAFKFCCAMRAPKNTIKLKRRDKGERGANEQGLYNREKGNRRSELRQMMHRSPSSTDAAVVAVVYKAICQAQAI